MRPMTSSARLLGGPPLVDGPERAAAHEARLGARPAGRASRDLIATLEASGLLGRGGAGFPVGHKWRSVAERSDGRAVVIANGAEGEPGSAKDRALMTHRPHLVLDGAALAAEAVGADEIIVYIGTEHRRAIETMGRALEEVRAAPVPIRIVEAPTGYVSGEQSAAVHFIESGDARPTTPYRPYERGVRGRPTLVQNVESLAHAALIARFGDAWYREVGHGPSRGTGLVTVTGAAHLPLVVEIELGTPVGETLAGLGVARDDVAAVLLGGYFGTWAPSETVWDRPLDPLALRDEGLAFGAGVISVLRRGECGVAATADILAYMAGESAAQCGPCVFGLGAIASASRRLAIGAVEADDLVHLERWAAQLRGRGACAHPDGAVGLLESALRVFGDEFRAHQRERRCRIPGRPGKAA